MALALIWEALRRHPFGILSTAALVISCAWAVGVSVLLALTLWMTASLVTMHLWYALERPLLLRRGCHRPDRLERERLRAIAIPPTVDVLVTDAAEPWLWRGLRSVVVSQGLLDLLEDRALIGLLTQATMARWSVTLAGQLLAWLGVLPFACACLLSDWLAQLGRLLALLVGWSLVIPLLLWPDGFVRWVGQLLGSMIVGLVGLMLIGSGFAAAGLALVLSWVIVGGMRTLLGWEWRRTEATLDQATVEAGLGGQLLEALELLDLTEPSGPTGLMGLPARSGASLSVRIERVWQALNHTD
jgi:hypothetical protein